MDHNALYGSENAEAQISIYGMDIARSSLARAKRASRSLLEPMRLSLMEAEDYLELDRLRVTARMGPSSSEATRCSRALNHISRAVEASRHFEQSAAANGGKLTSPKNRTSAWRVDPAAQLTAAAMDVSATESLSSKERRRKRKKKRRGRAKPLPEPKAERALRSLRGAGARRGQGFLRHAAPL